VYRTAVGYCGGIKEQPSYWKVCNDDEYDDYVEAVTIDYDPTVISYSGILDAFFHIHDAVRSGRSRQYASAIFTHNNEQVVAAAAAVEARRGVREYGGRGGGHLLGSGGVPSEVAATAQAAALPRARHAGAA